MFSNSIKLLFLSTILFSSIDLSRSKYIEIQRVNLNQTDSSNDNLLSASSSINFLNQQNLAYVGPIQIGTPPQTFYMIYDTGSDVLFVQMAGCTTCTNNPIKEIGYTPSFYQQAKSRTSNINYNSDANLYYGSLSAFGQYGTESVLLSGKEAQGFKMAFINQEGIGANGSKSPCFDGIMGLSNSDSSKNIFELGKQDGVLNTSLFSFALGDDKGKFFYDDIPEQYLNSPKVPSSMSDRWTFTVLGFTIGGVDYTTDLNFNDGLVDSGTSLMIIDQTIINSIARHNLRLQNLGGIYGVATNCDNCNCVNNLGLPDLVFYSRGAKIILPATQYMIVMQGYCVLGMQDNSNLGFLILGDVFMRQLVVTYDKEENEMYFFGYNSFFMKNQKTLGAFICFSIFTGLYLIASAFTVYQTNRTKQNLFSAHRQYLNERLI